LGYATAGVAGAIVALLAFFVPTAIIALIVARIWARIRTSPWPVAFRAAMLPVAVGLTLGSAYTLARAGLGDAQGLVVATLALLLMWRTRLPTPVVLAGTGAVGAIMGSFHG